MAEAGRASAREVVVTISKENTLSKIEIDGIEIPFACGVNVGNKGPYNEGPYEITVTIPVDGIKMVRKDE